MKRKENNANQPKQTTKEATTLMRRQTTRRIAILEIVFVAVCALFISSQDSAFAQMTHPDSNPQTNWDIRKTYFLRFPAAAQHGPDVEDNPEGHDVIRDKESVGPGVIVHGPGPVFSWPVTIPTATSEVPTLRDTAIMENLFDTFGYPVSDTQFQIIERYNHNRFLEQLYDPEKIMWLGTSIGSIQANSAGNSTANMAVNQNVTAIEYNMRPLYNFTIDEGNIWNRLRNELFVPMAILLLLPGAVLAQVRAIVAQGSPAIVGEVSPFEGIIKSIIAIFLIPGSYLVVNYGIDVSNSIKHTIATEFQRIAGEDMFELSKCAVKRAYPINLPQSNRNAIEHSEDPHLEFHDVWSPYESLTLNLRMYDPCLEVDESRVPDEDLRQAKPVNRLLVNSAGALNGLSWNILCAFQVVFLYYLWCMGPIAAALSVWPIGQLQDAFKNWVEGVLVVCFWTLFWMTILVLMAAFKGVGDSGTIYVTALETMAIAAVTSAFNFVGLVQSAGDMAKGQAAAAAQGKGAFAGQGAALQGGGMPGRGSTGARSSSGAPGSPGSGGTGGGGTNATRTPVLDGGRSGAQSGVISTGGGLQPSPTMSAAANTGLAGAIAGAGDGAGTGSGVDSGTGSVGLDAPVPSAGDPASATGAGADDPGLPPGEKAGAGDPMGRGGAQDAAAMAAGMALPAMDKGKGEAGAGTGDATVNLGLSQSSNISKFLQGGTEGLQGLSDMIDRAGPPLEMAAGLGLIGNDMQRQMANADAMVNAAVLGGQGINDVLKTATGNPAIDGLLTDAGLNMPDNAGPLTDAIHARAGTDLNAAAAADGIDPDFRGPQSQLARSAAQDLMNIDADPNQEGVQPLVSEQMLKDALNGDADAISHIDQSLGVSPEVLNNALHGDAGSASLMLAAAGHRGNDDPNSVLHRAAASGNLAATEAFNAASNTDENMILAAAHGDPYAAGEALERNGADTQAWMATRQMSGNELNSAGIPLERFREAQAGDVAAQQDISRTMGLGDNNFELVRDAAMGDGQAGATMLAAHGAQEMQNMSPDQIQQAISQGDASIIAAQSCDPNVLARAVNGDEAAMREIHNGIASDPNMLISANSNPDAASAIYATNGERPDVLAANAANTQGLLNVVDPGIAQQMAGADAEQRQDLLRQASEHLHIDPNTLTAAVAGGSIAGMTFAAAMADHPRVIEASDRGVPIAQAAVVARQGVSSEALHAAMAGNYSAGYNVQNSVAVNSELHRLAEAGNPEAGSFLRASQDIVRGGSRALTTEVNPNGAVYAASNAMQAHVGMIDHVNPVQLANGQGFENVYNAVGVDPGSMEARNISDVVQQGLVHGSGPAAVSFGAYMAQRSPEMMRTAADAGDPAAQAAIIASHVVPDHVVQQAVEGGDPRAQAYVQNAVANHNIMAMAANGNDQARRYVQTVHGSSAEGMIHGSANTQRLMRNFAPEATVRDALYESGPKQAAAIETIAHNMNLDNPAVLRNGLDGNAAPLFTAVSSHPVLTEAAQTGDQFARAVVDTGIGSHSGVTHMAANNNVSAARAVNMEVASNPSIQELAQHNPDLMSVRRAAAAATQVDPVVGPAHQALANNYRDIGGGVGMSQQQADFAEVQAKIARGMSQNKTIWGLDYSYGQHGVRTATGSPYVTYGSDGKQIVVDPSAGSVRLANAGDSHIAGYRYDSGAMARSSVDQGQIAQQQRAAEAQYRASQEADPGAGAQEGIQMAGDITGSDNLARTAGDEGVYTDLAPQPMSAGTNFNQISEAPYTVGGSIAAGGSMARSSIEGQVTGHRPELGLVARDEIQSAGITEAQFQQAQAGDINAQAEVSRALGVPEGNFNLIENAYNGNVASGATMIAARGRQEMQSMSPKEIKQAVQSGDASVIAARSVEPQVLARAASGDQGAMQEVSNCIATDPVMLMSAGANHDAARVVEATTGENPEVLASSVKNTYGVFEVMAGPKRAQEVLHAEPQQRAELLRQASGELNLDERILPAAFAGSTTAGAAFTAAVSDHPRMVEAYNGGNPVAQAAVCASQGLEPQSIRDAAGGDASAAMNIQNAIANNQELSRMASSGNTEAASFIHANQTVTYGGGFARSSAGDGAVYSDIGPRQEIGQSLSQAGIDDQYQVDPGSQPQTGGSHQTAHRPDTSGPTSHGPTAHRPDTSGPTSHGPTAHRPDTSGPTSHGPIAHTDTSGMSSHGHSAHERIDQKPPEASGSQGGFSNLASSQQPPDSAGSYSHQPTEGPHGSTDSMTASSDVRADQVRSEPDPGMIARGGGTYSRDAADGEQYIASKPDAGGSSLNNALRDALPGAAAAGGAAAQQPQQPQSQDDQARHAAEKAEMERQRDKISREREQEEQKRRKAEQERLSDKKKADYQRYRDKIQAEIDEIEAEAERYDDEEDPQL